MTLPGLDLDRLAAFLDSGPLTGDVLVGGKSNLTYLVTDGTERWVVRRPPLGHVLATAHDMAREHRVLSALHGSAVPVPQPLRLCTDETVLGAPFYVMRHVAGVALRDPAALEALGPAAVRALALSLVDTLAALHAVDPVEVGLADFGRPAGFAERQVRRWKRQLDASRSREVPGIDALHAGLAAAVPAGAGGTIVHGDFRLDNVLVADGTIRAVLDWEMSTLGDPLTDLALFLVYARRPLPASDGPDRAPTQVPGHPSADELAARYAADSGRPVDDLGWYLALAAFKLAVILEGVHFRHSRGQTVGAGFDGVGERVAPLVADGLRYLEGS